MAGESLGDGERGGNGESRENNAGNFRYLSSSQIQGSSVEKANSGDKDLVDRLQEVADFYADLNRNPDDSRRGYGAREIDFANKPRHLTSFHTQVSPVELPERFRAGRESLSVVRNITVRDSKRTKNRARDDDYKRRMSVSPSTMPYPASKSPAVSNEPYQHLRQEHSGTNAARPRTYASPNAGFGQREDDPEFPGKDFSPGHGWGNHNPGLPKGMPPISKGTPLPGTDSFDITLIFEGNRIGHRVDQHMPVMQLAEEAAVLFRLNPPDVILLLFGMHPRTLPRENRISDPPRVENGATVMVFNRSWMDTRQ